MQQIIVQCDTSPSRSWSTQSAWTGRNWSDWRNHSIAGSTSRVWQISPLVQQEHSERSTQLRSRKRVPKSAAVVHTRHNSEVGKAKIDLEPKVEESMTREGKDIQSMRGTKRKASEIQHYGPYMGKIARCSRSDTSVQSTHRAGREHVMTKQHQESDHPGHPLERPHIKTQKPGSKQHHSQTHQISGSNEEAESINFSPSKLPQLLGSEKPTTKVTTAYQELELSMQSDHPSRSYAISNRTTRSPSVIFDSAPNESSKLLLGSNALLAKAEQPLREDEQMRIKKSNQGPSLKNDQKDSEQEMKSIHQTKPVAANQESMRRASQIQQTHRTISQKPRLQRPRLMSPNLDLLSDITIASFYGGRLKESPPMQRKPLNDDSMSVQQIERTENVATRKIAPKNKLPLGAAKTPSNIYEVRQTTIRINTELRSQAKTEHILLGHYNLLNMANRAAGKAWLAVLYENSPDLYRRKIKKFEIENETRDYLGQLDTDGAFFRRSKKWAKDGEDIEIEIAVFEHEFQGSPN